jgi:hypothetical protein
MKKLLLPAIVVVAAIAILAYGRLHPPSFSGAPTAAVAVNDSVFSDAFENHASNIQVEGQGTVAKILPDDMVGSRHQRFIVRLKSGQTILIAHNIDLAERVSPLNKGDVITFSGVYEWKPEGGVVHWTHHDPDGRHRAGWIRHHGQAFQ